MLLKQQSQQKAEPPRIARKQPQHRERQVSFAEDVRSSPNRIESFASSNLVNNEKLDRARSLRQRPNHLSKSLTHERFVTMRVLDLQLN